MTKKHDKVTEKTVLQKIVIFTYLYQVTKKCDKIFVTT